MASALNHESMLVADTLTSRRSIRWPYVRFFMDQVYSWKEVTEDDLAKAVWLLVSESSTELGKRFETRSGHRCMLTRVAETASPLHWTVVECVVDTNVTILTFAEAKPWQVAKPDFFLDIYRANAQQP